MSAPVPVPSARVTIFVRQRNRVAGIPDAGMTLVSIAERIVKDDWLRPDLDSGALEPVPEP